MCVCVCVCVCGGNVCFFFFFFFFFIIFLQVLRYGSRYSRRFQLPQDRLWMTFVERPGGIQSAALSVVVFYALADGVQVAELELSLGIAVLGSLGRYHVAACA